MPRTLLMVDDDPAMQEMFTFLFRRTGFQLRSAATAEEARLLIRQKTPDLILLDLHLGGDDGLELAAELSLARPGIPIAIVSASFETPVQERIQKAGCAGFFVKPINPRTFVTEVMAFLPAKAMPSFPIPAKFTIPDLRQRFLEEALKALADLAQRGDEILFSDSLLAEAAHRWAGASGIGGIPDVRTLARELETLARGRRTDQAARIRENLFTVQSEFTDAYSLAN